MSLKTYKIISYVWVKFPRYLITHDQDSAERIIAYIQEGSKMSIIGLGIKSVSCLI